MSPSFGVGHHHRSLAQCDCNQKFGARLQGFRPQDTVVNRTVFDIPSIFTSLDLLIMIKLRFKLNQLGIDDYEVQAVFIFI